MATVNGAGATAAGDVIVCVFGFDYVAAELALYRIFNYFFHLYNNPFKLVSEVVAYRVAVFCCFTPVIKCGVIDG